MSRCAPTTFQLQALGTRITDYGVLSLIRTRAIGTLIEGRSSTVPCAFSSSGPLCGSQEEPPPVRPPRRHRVGPARRAAPLEPPPRLCGRLELQPRQLPRPLTLRLGVPSPR